MKIKPNLFAMLYTINTFQSACHDSNFGNHDRCKDTILISPQALLTTYSYFQHHTDSSKVSHIGIQSNNNKRIEKASRKHAR